VLVAYWAWSKHCIVVEPCAQVNQFLRRELAQTSTLFVAGVHQPLDPYLRDYFYFDTVKFGSFHRSILQGAYKTRQENYIAMAVPGTVY
jgi:hypothetical protein